MKERGILFSAPMVRALLDDRKTQTRRAIKGVPSWDHYGRDIMDCSLSGIHQDEDDLVGTDRWALDVQTDVDDYCRHLIRCPYGAPGDRLWVRETCRAVELPNGRDGVHYLADGSFGPIENTAEAAEHWGKLFTYRKGRGRKVVAIHMPRWASRILLEIAEVRVERLNACTEEDALAEGVVWSEGWGGYYVPGVKHPNKDFPVLSRSTARGMYAALWDMINGSGSWLANPWVWAVSFRRVDQEGRAA